MKNLTACYTLIYLLAGQVFAHHGHFYRPIFKAVENKNVASIKTLFSESAWKGKVSGISADNLQERLNAGNVDRPMYHFSSFAPRDKVIIWFQIDYPHVEPGIIRILGKDIDPEPFEYEWQIVQIVDTDEEAQAFFEHAPPR